MRLATSSSLHILDVGGVVRAVSELSALVCPLYPNAVWRCEPQTFGATDWLVRTRVVVEEAA